MKKIIVILMSWLATLVTFAQTKTKTVCPKHLNIETRIDSLYAFGFDLKESRDAKGAIWNLKTGQAVTPLSYSRAQIDTLEGTPVVKLYRQVVWGNHPLNGWETWMRKADKWVRFEPADLEKKQ